MNPKTTGLVLIEFQNDFVTEGGTLHDAVADVMASTDMLNHAVAAAEAVRAAGGTVLYQPIAFAPGYNEITAHPYGILAGVVASSSFVKGGWGAEIAAPIAPKEGDIVLEGKRGLDSFASANIDFVLRSKGIETVVLAGFLTNCCVESTMRTAYEKGFEVITLTDAVAATSQEEHDNAIKYDYPMFSKPMTTAEFTEALAGAAVADTSRGY
ncbi:MAG: cysteine hydrolase [Propionibacteriaceae bacterium]|jgi:nicotinamidase-related amidase|nr:cysteine hydrolase [Propionibacteriaceae bacterium]